MEKNRQPTERTHLNDLGLFPHLKKMEKTQIQEKKGKTQKPKKSKRPSRAVPSAGAVAYATAPAEGIQAFTRTALAGSLIFGFFCIFLDFPSLGVWLGT